MLRQWRRLSSSLRRPFSTVALPPLPATEQDDRAVTLYRRVDKLTPYKAALSWMEVRSNRAVSLHHVTPTELVLSPLHSE